MVDEQTAHGLIIKWVEEDPEVWTRWRSWDGGLDGWMNGPDEEEEALKTNGVKTREIPGEKEVRKLTISVRLVRGKCEAIAFAQRPVR